MHGVLVDPSLNIVLIRIEPRQPTGISSSNIEKRDMLRKAGIHAGLFFHEKEGTSIMPVTMLVASQVISRNFSLFLDRIAGPTVATVPVCIKLDHNAQINELLLQI